MISNIIGLTSEHLVRKSQALDIKQIHITDFKHNYLSLRQALNAEVIIYKNNNEELKILKNKFGVTGLLLNNRLLSELGWVYNPQKNAYCKTGETITLEQGPTLPLVTSNNEQVVIINTLFICQIGYKEPIKLISTLEELNHFYEEEDFIVHNNRLN